ncbi:MAG: hypothetical protein LUG18_15270 [Candidatus Azobacteroides sp.]|nr:hypothetical protein [Candidatus Azobacteroides sp.]
MDEIKFGHEGGFPFTQDTLAWMQNTYSTALNAIAKSFGSRVIISGCEESTNSVSDGWALYNGELIFVKGGSKLPYVRLNGEASGSYSLDFLLDKRSKKVMLKRQMEFTSLASGNVPWSDFKRINSFAGGGLIDSINALYVKSGEIDRHIGSTSNPHEVSFDQLKNVYIPNYKSDSLNSPNAESLATSKAVYDLKQTIGLQLVGRVLTRATIIYGRVNKIEKYGIVRDFISNVIGGNNGMLVGDYTVILSQPINCRDYLVLPFIENGVATTNKFYPFLNDTGEYLEDPVNVNEVNLRVTYNSYLQSGYPMDNQIIYTPVLQVLVYKFDNNMSINE